MIGQNDNINLEVKDKKKVILAFYGLFYILILVIIIIAGYSYLGKLTTFSRNSVTPAVLKTDTAANTTADLPIVKGTTTPPIDLAKEIVSTPDKVAKGKTLFEANCVSCHGAEGKGDGAAGKTLNPKPRNFHELTGWTNGPQFANMYKTLHEGITSRGMASYSNLKPEERIDLILYICTFNPSFPPIDQKDIQAVDAAYNLSKGVKMPNQIPLKMAEEKILEENKSANEKAENIISTITKENNDKGAAAFKKISFDVKRSVYALAGYAKWNENESQFVNFVSTSPFSKGFNASLSNISQDEWTAAFQYLKNLFAK